MDNVHNVVIIGGGPAGLSAAVYNARASLAPLLFAGSPPGGQLMLTTEVENFPGYKDILGPDLIEKLREQAKAFGTDIRDSNITEVDFSSRPFKISTSKETVASHSVIIATGAKALWLGLESEQRLLGRGVSACATCDGFFFRDKIVAVVGGGDTAMEESQTLTRFAKKVYLIHRRDQFRASQIMQERVMNNPKIEIIWNTSVEEVLGKEKVDGLRLRRQGESTQVTDSLPVDGLFLAIGHKPDTDLFKDKIQLDDNGYILTSAIAALELSKVKSPKSKNEYKDFNFHYQTMTSLAGVFAAGDCVDHTYRQAGTAAGMGIAAALDAEKWLSENNI